MGILDAPATDWRGHPLAQFAAARDLVTPVATWDAGLLTGAHGSSVLMLPDTSGNGAHASAQNNTTVAPLLNGPLSAGALGGKPTLKFTGTQVLLAAARSDWPVLANLPQPFAMYTVARASSTLGLATARTLLGGTTATGATLLLVLSDGRPMIAAGALGSSGGPPLTDDSWHIWIGMFGTTTGWLMIDGFLVNATVTQAHGANSQPGVGIGAAFGGGTTHFYGDIAECGIIQGNMTLQMASDFTAHLNRKWGMGL